MRGAVLVVLGVAACGRVGFDDVASDGSTDGDTLLGPWSAPMPVPVAMEAIADEEDCTGAANKRELYFIGDTRLFVSTRPTETAAWEPRTQILPGNGEDGGGRLSPDDLTLYFSSTRTPGGDGSMDIWRATRATITSPWSTPANLTEVNTPGVDKWLSVCAGGRYLIVRDSGTDDDIYEGTFGGGPATRVDALSSTSSDSGVSLSADCTTVYFASTRNGTEDIFVSSRDASGAWRAPTLFGEVSTPDQDDEDPWMSPDRRLFVFARGFADRHDLYMMVR